MPGKKAVFSPAADYRMPIRALSIHGHFYQPPREDPITGEIPYEVGAAPYKNWNERIQAECYRPNAELGNFERISFNLGPTLCEWMVENDLATLRLIAAQDRANVKKHGIGNSIAQPFNHTILPLATLEDKITQVYWGVKAFEHGFGRSPTGIWLPETAADTETLMVLADHGIEFTILAPWQADLDYLDPTEPYRVALPNGRSITVFFYHRELSSRVSFDPLITTNADQFVQEEVASRFLADKARRGEPQLLLIASDGELYGHHQTFRDHFLAHLVNGASSHAGITTTNLALWLKSHPPRRTISIREKTSWSCHHGVLRWSGECGCTPDYGIWKMYLRRGLDALAAEVDGVYREAVLSLGFDPLQLRNRYIHAMMGRMPIETLLTEMAGRALSSDQIRRVALLLDAQRQRQRMFTSCGWFFEDFSRIEPKNNVAYAAQAVRLTRQATGIDLSGVAIDALRHVISHRTGLRGDIIFKKQLQRAEKSV